MSILLPTRRRALSWLAAAPGAAWLGCRPQERLEPAADPTAPIGLDAILAVEALPLLNWPTDDPFLFCAHHHDAFPPGNAQMGPQASLAGRRIGRDFDHKDGWNMYHGKVVPGFPRHPHRGFETVTVVLNGLLDHSDSLGATARYGNGDVQWLTAGAGIQHAEMFPLLRSDTDNPLELFQIWLNLPAANKMVSPYFSMLWGETIPTIALPDAAGRTTRLTIVAGGFQEIGAPRPPPESYASHVDAHVAIWKLAMDPGAAFTLPAQPIGTRRSIYFHRGESLYVAGTRVPGLHRVVTHGDSDIALVAGDAGAEILVLSGRAIGEPVARQGPFVMNTPAEIKQAYADYQATGFGGWPWTSDDHVQDRAEGRFALHPDGRLDRPA